MANSQNVLNASVNTAPVKIQHSSKYRFDKPFVLVTTCSVNPVTEIPVVILRGSRIRFRKADLMLENKVIVYDDSCPMCKIYTFWFVAIGLLKPENRVGFASASAEITSNIDLNRGRHEIPLYDRATGETIYGLKAMTHILASRWGWLNPLFESKPFWWTFYPMYEIITYNRRVIAGCKHCCGFDCAPDLNKFYRSIYLGIAGTFILTICILLMLTGSLFGTIGLGALIAFGSYGLIAGTVHRLASGSVASWNFAGNYFTTLVIVAAAMLPGIFFGAKMPEALLWGTLGAAALLGITEIRRRDL